MNTVLIRQGYIVTVKTWENDGDNYKTEQFHGLTLGEATAIVNMAKDYTADRYPQGGCDDAPEYGTIGTEINKQYCEGNFINADKSAYSDQFWLDDMIFEVVGTWCDGEYLRTVEEVDIGYVEKACMVIPAVIPNA